MATCVRWQTRTLSGADMREKAPGSYSVPVPSKVFLHVLASSELCSGEGFISVAESQDGQGGN